MNPISIRVLFIDFSVLVVISFFFVIWKLLIVQSTMALDSPNNKSRSSVRRTESFTFLIVILFWAFSLDEQISAAHIHIVCLEEFSRERRILFNVVNYIGQKGREKQMGTKFPVAGAESAPAERK